MRGHREVTPPICVDAKKTKNNNTAPLQNSEEQRNNKKKTKLQNREKNGDYSKTANFLRIMVNQQVV